MGQPSPMPQGPTQWRSATVCPKCRYALDLENLDLLAITTGMATCPKCGWTGYIDIEIVACDEDSTPN